MRINEIRRKLDVIFIVESLKDRIHRNSVVIAFIVLNASVYTFKALCFLPYYSIDVSLHRDRRVATRRSSLHRYSSSDALSNL